MVRTWGGRAEGGGNNKRYNNKRVSAAETGAPSKPPTLQVLQVHPRPAYNPLHIYCVPTHLVAAIRNGGILCSAVVAVAVVAAVPLRSLIKPYLDRILLQRPRLDSLVLVVSQPALYVGCLEGV